MNKESPPMYYLPHCSQLTSNYAFKGLLISTVCNYKGSHLFIQQELSLYVVRRLTKIKGLVNYHACNMRFIKQAGIVDVD